jgi:hypothetical protein
MTFFGQMNFRSNGVRSNGVSIKWPISQMVFGQTAFGQMVFRSNGLSVKRCSVEWCFGQMAFGKKKSVNFFFFGICICLFIRFWITNQMNKQILAQQPFLVKVSPFGISRNICFFYEVGLSHQCPQPLLHEEKTMTYLGFEPWTFGYQVGIATN